MRRHLRTWEEDGFRLELYGTDQFDRQGVEYVAYEFFHEGELVFVGDDYSPSPKQDPADDDAVAGLLEFLALRPGGTNHEWFDRYSPRQLAWADAHAQHLNWLSHQLEEAARNERPAGPVATHVGPAA